MNIKILKLMLTLFILSSLTVACVARREVTKAPLMPPKKTIMAVGYGTVEPNRYSSVQRRLMGMRASKVEAFRALAEQIYGVHVNSNTTVENMAAKYDSIRSYVDAIIRGARVKRITAIDADTYETVLEVDLTPQFYECFGGSEVALNSCLSATLGISRSVPSQEPLGVIPEPIRAACNTGYCYNYPDVHGFTLAYNRPNYLVEMLQETSRQFLETTDQIYTGFTTVNRY